MLHEKAALVIYVSDLIRQNQSTERSLTYQKKIPGINRYNRDQNPRQIQSWPLNKRFMLCICIHMVKWMVQELLGCVFHSRTFPISRSDTVSDYEEVKHIYNWSQGTDEKIMTVPEDHLSLPVNHTPCTFIPWLLTTVKKTCFYQEV